MINASSTKLLAQFIGSCEAKISYGDAVAIIKAENVLWLQVAMVDAKAVAILNCVKQLQKYMPDQDVVAEVAAVVENLREQVVVRSIVQNDIGAVTFLNHAVESDHVGVRAGDLMECYFTDMDLSLAVQLVRLSNEALDGVRLGVEGMIVHRAVNDAITTDTQHLHEFEGVPINESPDGGM